MVTSHDRVLAHIVSFLYDLCMRHKKSKQLIDMISSQILKQKHPGNPLSNTYISLIQENPQILMRPALKKL